jgi:hypothetical protein
MSIGLLKRLQDIKVNFKSPNFYFSISISFSISILYFYDRLGMANLRLETHFENFYEKLRMSGENRRKAIVRRKESYQFSVISEKQAISDQL